MPERPGTRALIVTKCEVTHQGTGKNDKPYTIYEVEATTDDGSPVGLPLRSFDDLTPLIGKVTTFEISPYTSQRGTTYTLKPPKERFGPRVEALEKRILELEERIRRLEGGANWQPQSQARQEPTI